MRNLTITRNKSFVGCLGKLKVYIESPMDSELIISGVPCKKLGDLKNGETKTFSISEDALRVVVIADQLSKNYCHEFYRIPAGAEPVLLSGKCHYNPGAGNPFRFDGNDDPEVLASRKKNGRKGIWILVGSLLLGVALGVGLNLLDTYDDKSPRTFQAEELQITLTGAYDAYKEDGFAGCYSDGDAAIFVIKEPLYTLEGLDISNLEDYANAVISVSVDTGCQIQQVDGLTYIEYDYNVDGDDMNYFVVFFKSVDAYWQVSFAVDQADAQTMRSQFIEYAKSVTFK